MCKAVFGNRAVICRYYVLTMKVPDWVESGSRRRPESRHRRLKAQMAGLHSEPAICLLEANVRFGRGAVVQKSLRETARLSFLPFAVWTDEGPDWVVKRPSRQHGMRLTYDFFRFVS